MKLQKIFSILFVAIAAITLHSCNSDNSDNTIQVANIVTFQGNIEGQSVFTYQEINDGEKITIRSNQTIDETKEKVGDRVYIVFNLNNGTTLTNNSVVSLLTAIGVPTINTQIENRPADWESTQGIYVQDVIRTGTWLNLLALVPSTTENMTFRLLADPSTINSSDVQLYMVYTNSAAEFGTSNVSSFASFNIADVWNLPSCSKVTFHVINTNEIAKSTFVFEKK